MGYFSSLSKLATVHWLDGSEWALLISGIVLAIGVIGEIRVGEFSHLLKIFEYLALLGILGDFVAEGGIFLFSTQLQIISDHEVSEARARSAEAQDRAAKANERAASAEFETAALQLALAQSTVPRSLDLASQRRVGETACHFKGHDAWITYRNSEFDGPSFSLQLERALGGSGCDVIVHREEDRGLEVLPTASALAEDFTGVQILHTSDPRSIAFASALAATLRADGLKRVVLLPGIRVTPETPKEYLRYWGRIMVRIGRKP